MVCGILFEIAQPQLRQQALTACHQVGLHRVQTHFFLGQISPNKQDELRLRLEQCHDPATDKVYIFTMDAAHLKQSTFMGQAIDPNLLTGQLKTLMF